MSSYNVLQDYTGTYRERIVLVEGQVADIDDETAAWINRDRPGTLEPHVEARRQKKRQTRQVTKADNRQEEDSE